jgi:hypothetical protein
MQEISVQLTDHPKPKPADESKLGFGTIFFGSHVCYEL